MGDIDAIQDIRERLIRIEGKIENSTERYNSLDKRVTKIEDNNTWLNRAIIAQIIVAIAGFFMFKK